MCVCGPNLKFRLLDLLNAKLCLERYWRGPRSVLESEGGDQFCKQSFHLTVTVTLTE